MIKQFDKKRIQRLKFLKPFKLLTLNTYKYRQILEKTISTLLVDPNFDNCRRRDREIKRKWDKKKVYWFLENLKRNQLYLE